MSFGPENQQDMMQEARAELELVGSTDVPEALVDTAEGFTPEPTPSLFDQSRQEPASNVTPMERPPEDIAKDPRAVEEFRMTLGHEIVGGLRAA